MVSLATSSRLAQFCSKLLQNLPASNWMKMGVLMGVADKKLHDARPSND